jgi:hypothetical protein
MSHVSTNYYIANMHAVQVSVPMQNCISHCTCKYACSASLSPNTELHLTLHLQICMQCKSQSQCRIASHTALANMHAVQVLAPMQNYISHCTCEYACSASLSPNAELHLTALANMHAVQVSAPMQNYISHCTCEYACSASLSPNAELHLTLHLRICMQCKSQPQCRITSHTALEATSLQGKNNQQSRMRPCIYMIILLQSVYAVVMNI